MLSKMLPMRAGHSLRDHVSSYFLTLFLTLLVAPATPYAKAQFLNWSAGTRYDNQIGGVPQRQGVGAAVFNNTLFVAYADPYLVDQFQNSTVYIMRSTNGIDFSPPERVVIYSISQYIVSSATPALAVFNGKLYIAWNTGQGSANFASSSDGSTWDGFVEGYRTNVDNSPSIASFNGVLYSGVRNAQDQTLEFCRIFTDDTNYCVQWPNNRLGFNPGLGVFNGQLYIGYQDINTHDIWFLYTADGNNFVTSGNATNDQTSTAPAFAVHNNILYLGFRTNDGDHKFLYKYSYDGVNFSGGVDPHYQMGGPSGLIDGSGLAYSIYNGNLFNLFTSNDTSHNLYSTNAP